MPFLIGLEYATYRYLKLPAKYASHYSFVSKPAECSICFTDFSIQWVKDDQDRILCNDCAVRPVKKKIKKESQKQLKRTIISCFTKEYGKISKTYEHRRNRKRQTSKENVDPADSEVTTSLDSKSQEPTEKTDEDKVEETSKSIDESKPDQPKPDQSSSDDQLEKPTADEENDETKADKDEPNPTTEPETEPETEHEVSSHESGDKERDAPTETLDEPMADNQEDETGGILDQLSKDVDQVDSENDDQK